MEEQTVKELLSLQELDAVIVQLRTERQSLKAERTKVEEAFEALVKRESAKRARVEVVPI